MGISGDERNLLQGADICTCSRHGTWGGPAENMVAWKVSDLILPGLTQLDAATAEKLAAFKGKVLTLNGLTQLDAATRKKLAAWKGEIFEMKGLTREDKAGLWQAF